MKLWIAFAIACLLGAAGWYTALTQRDASKTKDGLIAQARIDGRANLDQKEAEIADLRRNLARCRETSSEWEQVATAADGTTTTTKGKATVTEPVAPCPPCPQFDGRDIDAIRAAFKNAIRGPRALFGVSAVYPWSVGADVSLRLGKVYVGPTVGYALTDHYWWYGGRLIYTLL